ncbi:MAG: NAD(P)/FAD-dependent oxidoreductase [Thaumarchaeota archaeon]|nr:NAD(P)/FAD-dependent oxidoreductase [Nitrososphaerota archaeon]
MNIAVVGMGVAGSYLASRLRDAHNVVGFDRLSEDKFDAVCAWGTSRHGINRFAKDCGLNFEDFVLFDGREMLVDMGNKKDPIGIKLKGLCTFDKRAFIMAMAKGTEMVLGKQVSQTLLNEDFDMIVDATGLPRPLLPRIKQDIMIPCVQYKVKMSEHPYDDFYIKPLSGLSGYFWYFPLENGYAHIGGGDYHRTHNEELNRFIKDNKCEVLKKVGRPVRITPPSQCEPFFEGKVVGVGESIGSVYPLLGEGIIPSLQCADLLADNLGDLANYRAEVLSKFRIYQDVFNFIKAKIQGRFSLFSQLPGLMSMFWHMKTNDKRYGMDIKLMDMLKVVRNS